MTRTIHTTALSIIGVIGLLAVWLTYQQTAAADYRDDVRNVRSFSGPETDARGNIVTSGGVIVATDGPEGRTYPEGSAYAHVVGIDRPGRTRSGIEGTRFDDLSSRDDGSITAFLTELFGGDLGPPTVRLTLVDAVQRAAVAGLGGEHGAVVALDPRTGAILGYASGPTFDPNTADIGDLEADRDEPLVDRVTLAIYPPGSTFKTIVAAAAIDALGMAPDTVLPDAAEYQPPGGGNVIRNASGGFCGDGTSLTLERAVAVSCNTVFSSLAVELGGDGLVRAAEQAGFNSRVSWELGSDLASIPEAAALDADPPALAQTGLGERDLRATPIHMALIAAGIANEGVAMKPYAVAEVIAPDGEVLERTDPGPLRVVMSAPIAGDLTTMMIEVVASGTGRVAAVTGVEVAGKTGTATGPGGPYTWFIGFAPADDPVVAVAVVVEAGGVLGESGTGGSVAAPIAAAVMAAALGGGS